MDRKQRQAVLRGWADLELPAGIASWLQGLTEALPQKSDRYWERAARFVRHAGSSDAAADTVRKAWANIALAVRADRLNDDPPELAVFLGLPDEVTVNPHSAVYGERPLDRHTVVQDRKAYAELVRNVDAVMALLGPPYAKFAALLQDAGATEGAHQLAGAFRREHEEAMRVGLPVLRALLQAIDPADKIPTKHWQKDDAANTVFANSVANLNRHLSTPQHTALTRLARINCPTSRITIEQVRAAWKDAVKRA